MRTPNTHCALCAKPLYRRPSDMAHSRYVACMACRAKAQSVFGVTDAQAAGLSSGRVKGRNNRVGFVHRPETKAKIGASNEAFLAANPEVAIARGEKIRGENHYQWKGGVTRLNLSIRRMNENRKWMDGVKSRDGRCLRCGSADDLESHHIVELADLIDRFNIKSRDDARRHADQLWALSNGETLCRACHWQHHGRIAA